MLTVLCGRPPYRSSSIRQNCRNPDAAAGCRTQSGPSGKPWIRAVAEWGKTSFQTHQTQASGLLPPEHPKTRHPRFGARDHENWSEPRVRIPRPLPARFPRPSLAGPRGGPPRPTRHGRMECTTRLHDFLADARGVSPHVRKAPRRHPPSGSGSGFCGTNCRRALPSHEIPGAPAYGHSKGRSENACDSIRQEARHWYICDLSHPDIRIVRLPGGQYIANRDQFSH